MSNYAVGKHAFGFCDRCGFRYPLRELNTEVQNLEVVNFRVCPTCWDPMNPQTTLGRRTFNDPHALRNPRPPLGLTQSRFGDSIRYDFLTDADEWEGDSSTTVTYQSASQSILVKNDIGFPYTISRDELSVKTGHWPDADNQDDSIYTNVRLFLKPNFNPLDVIGVPRVSGWVGTMTWVGGAGGSNTVASPDFDAMGDTSKVVTWDMSGDAAWIASTTVTKVTFEFFSASDVQYGIDYIRFETD